MHSSLPSLFAAALAFLLAVSSNESYSQDFVDDLEIKKSLQKHLENLLEDTTIPSGASLIKQLRAQTPKAEGLALGKAPSPLAKPDGPLYDRLRSATMVVGNIYKCDKCDKWHTGTAGGVVLSPDGLLLTNYHVIDAKNPRIFGALSSEGEFYPIIKVVHASKANDLALVQLGKASDLAYATLASDSQVGDSVYSVSHPDSHYFSFGAGAITRFYLSPRGKTPLGQVNLNFAKGSSGAGVFNTNAELSGLIVSTKSIYYETTKTEQKNLQMVVRSIVPLSSIRSLLSEAKLLDEISKSN